MAELVDDANEYAKSIGLAGDLSMDSFADQIQAIELIQQKQGIAGTTANEAASTISGSITMLQAAWQNLLTGIADPNADLTTLLDNVFSSLGSVAENSLPTLRQIFESLAETLPDAFSRAMEMLPTVLQENFGDVFEGLFSSMPGGESIAQTFETLGETIGEHLPVLAEVAGAIADAAGELGGGFVQAITDAQAALAPFLDPLLSLLEVFGRLAAGAMSSVGQMVGGFMQLAPVQSIIEHLRSAFETIAQYIVDNQDAIAGLGGQLGEIGGQLGGIVLDAIDGVAAAIEIVAPIVMDLAEGALPAVSGALDLVSGALEWLGEMIGGLIDFQLMMLDNWSEIYDEAAPLLYAAFEYLGEILSDVGSFFSEAAEDARADWESLVDWFSGVPDEVVGFFSDVGADIGEKFQEAYDTVTQIFEDLKTTVSGIPDSIVGFFQGLGSRITTAIGSIHMPKPHITWEDASTAGSIIKLPSVSWYATGGYVPETRLIGIGEAGAEAILPLEGAHMMPFADAIADRLKDSGNTNIYINDARVNDDKQVAALFTAFMQELNRKQRMYAY
jgi:phage-related protein